MSEEKEIQALEVKVNEVTAQLRKAKNIIVIGGPILIGALTAFFGITYNNIGSQVDKAISEYISGEAFKKATDEVDHASVEATRKISKSVSDAEEKINDLEKSLQNHHDSVKNTVPIIMQTLTKLDNYQDEAEARLQDIEDALGDAKSLLPSIKKFSVYGTAKHGETIKIPEGTIDNWSIMISPKYIGISDESISSNKTPLLSADYQLKVDSSTSWKVFAVSRYQFGASVKSHYGEVNYLLIPNTLTK